MKRKSARKTAMAEPDRSLCCHTCGRVIAGFESVHYGSIELGYRDLCNRCFNEEGAKNGGINCSHVEFEPLETITYPSPISRHCVCAKLAMLVARQVNATKMS
jgi:hypothetical protein